MAKIPVWDSKPHSHKQRNQENSEIVAYATVDDSIADQVQQYTWRRDLSGNAHANIKQPDGKRKGMTLQRYAYFLLYGHLVQKPEVVTLRDPENRFRCTKQDLLLINKAENRRPNAYRSTKYEGIHYSVDRGQYRVQLTLYGPDGQQKKKIDLGHHDTEERAAQVKNEAVRKWFPEHGIPHPEVETKRPEDKLYAEVHLGTLEYRSEIERMKSEGWEPTLSLSEVDYIDTGERWAMADLNNEDPAIVAALKAKLDRHLAGYRALKEIRQRLRSERMRQYEALLASPEWQEKENRRKLIEAAQRNTARVRREAEEREALTQRDDIHDEAYVAAVDETLERSS